MNIDPILILIILVISVTSIILHELAHGVVAYALGDDTAKEAGRLTLNPFKHIDPIMSILVPVVLYILNAPVFGGAKPVPVNYNNLKGREWGMALVALAGPMTNFLLALIMFLIGYFTGAWFDLGSIGQFVFRSAVELNLGFMIFNLIPIPPLDGSRVLYAIAPDFIRKFLMSIERFGVIIVYVLILFFGEFFSSLMVDGMNGILHLFYLMVGA